MTRAGARMRGLLFGCVLLAACSGANDSSGDAAHADAGTIAPAIHPTQDLPAFFDCVREQGLTLVAAHRGGPAPGYPENAVETFQHLTDRIPALIELDVATSKDGVLFLMHDDDLDRTTTGSGPASGLTWAEIQSLRLQDDSGRTTAFHPPTLDRALAFAKDKAILEIDFKHGTRYEAVIDAVKRAGATNRVLYIAYTLDQGARLHRLHPEAMLSLEISSLDALDAAVARGIPADRILAWTGIDAPDPALYAALKNRGVEVIFGTLGGRHSIDSQIAAAGNDARYRTFAGMGATILATDRPLAAYAALKAGEPASGTCGVDAPQ